MHRVAIPRRAEVLAQATQEGGSALCLVLGFHTGRPLGPVEFVQTLEHQTERRLVPQKGGRPRQPAAGETQEAFVLTDTENR